MRERFLILPLDSRYIWILHVDRIRKKAPNKFIPRIDILPFNSRSSVQILLTRSQWAIRQH
jgi:hypothetical protein